MKLVKEGENILEIEIPQTLTLEVVETVSRLPPFHHAALSPIISPE